MKYLTVVALLVVLASTGLSQTKAETQEVQKQVCIQYHHQVPDEHVSMLRNMPHAQKIITRMLGKQAHRECWIQIMDLLPALRFPDTSISSEAIVRLLSTIAKEKGEDVALIQRFGVTSLAELAVQDDKLADQFVKTAVLNTIEIANTLVGNPNNFQVLKKLNASEKSKQEMSLYQYLFELKKVLGKLP